MKRLFLLLSIIIFITSCTNKESIDNVEADVLINETTKDQKAIESGENSKTINKNEEKEILEPLYNEYHPIVVDGLLIGGSKNNEWIDVSRIADIINGNEKYTVADEKYDVVTGIGGTIEKNEGTGAELINIETDSSLKGITVSYSGNWDPFPRKPQNLNNDNETYKKITREVLMSHGLNVQEPKINDIYRLDLDGDKVDEVLIEASYYKDNELSPAPRKGNYSLIFLRKIVDGKVKNIEILNDIYTEDLSFEKGPSYLNEILALIDLNGDGKMEVVIKSQYYEGHGIIIYELKGDQIEDVISNADGV